MDSSGRPVITALSVVPIVFVTKYPEIVVHANLDIMVISATQAARPIVKKINVIRQVGYVQRVLPGIMAAIAIRPACSNVKTTDVCKAMESVKTVRMDSSDRPVMSALSVVPIMSVTKYPETVVHADLDI
ncbi:uncharacterized protein LOC110460421 [Mizuhopecten yessoensis]|uniref:uncharacterized protein LOC110460421 n=1 Tax=Mizuhopecten yessoensis TaxID=6573 RepID=UPI000B45806A|nr:uncharacterized protein LOC110460421 [Mizuhopecten yessoensis]